MKRYTSGFQKSIVKYVLQCLSIYYKKINPFNKVNSYSLRRSSKIIVGSLHIIVIHWLWYIETWKCLTFYNNCLLDDSTYSLNKLVFYFESIKCWLKRNLKLYFGLSLTHLLARTEDCQNSKIWSTKWNLKV